MIKQNENMPKVSIIVPIYKAEKYLNRCIDSILAQTFTDWELLLIDDGSPDRSGEICDEYAQKDSRIRVFHKKNGGVSSARNLGLDNVQGEYVTFVDSDDWIDMDNMAICIPLMIANVLDVLQYSFKRVDDKKKVLYVKEVNSKVLDLQHYISNDSFYCVWGAYIRTSIISENKIRFDENLKLAEDQIFMMTVMSNSNRFQAINSVYYNYYFNTESATNNEKVQDLIQSSYCCMDYKLRYPVFTYRIDDLVLFFVEKLILKCRYKDVYKIMTKFRPTYYQQRPWPSICMAYLSSYNVWLGVLVGCLLYPLYCSFMSISLKFRSFINTNIICRK